MTTEQLYSSNKITWQEAVELLRREGKNMLADFIYHINN